MARAVCIKAFVKIKSISVKASPQNWEMLKSATSCAAVKNCATLIAVVTRRNGKVTTTLN